MIIMIAIYIYTYTFLRQTPGSPFSLPQVRVQVIMAISFLKAMELPLAFPPSADE
jgi:hypothetical protein